MHVVLLRISVPVIAAALHAVMSREMHQCEHVAVSPAAAAAAAACRRVALLAAGDLAVLLAFAAVGRGHHGEPLTVSDTLTTALPFVIGESVT
jgi:glycine/serine hydroxymethyltransferase